MVTIGDSPEGRLRSKIIVSKEGGKAAKNAVRSELLRKTFHQGKSLWEKLCYDE
jgi:hypothetical protein